MTFFDQLFHSKKQQDLEEAYEAEEEALYSLLKDKKLELTKIQHQIIHLNESASKGLEHSVFQDAIAEADFQEDLVEDQIVQLELKLKKLKEKYKDVGYLNDV